VGRSSKRLFLFTLKLVLLLLGMTLFGHYSVRDCTCTKGNVLPVVSGNEPKAQDTNRFLWNCLPEILSGLLYKPQVVPEQV
jgi:hypothetical protein